MSETEPIHPVMKRRKLGASGMIALSAAIMAGPGYLPGEGMVLKNINRKKGPTNKGSLMKFIEYTDDGEVYEDHGGRRYIKDKKGTIRRIKNSK